MSVANVKAITVRLDQRVEEEASVILDYENTVRKQEYIRMLILAGHRALNGTKQKPTLINQSNISAMATSQENASKNPEKTVPIETKNQDNGDRKLNLSGFIGNQE